MAKLTETYLRNMIKQVLKENEEGRYPPPYEEMTQEDTIAASIMNVENYLESILYNPTKNVETTIKQALEELDSLRSIIGIED